MATSGSTLYRHYGWEVSPFSAKTRWYLKMRGIPFKDYHPNAYQLWAQIQRPLGFMVMPVLHSPDGVVLQDSTVIINELEEIIPEGSMRPSNRKQQLAESLLELFGDEWMPIISMHTRWNTPGNPEFATGEFARNTFPFVPEALSRRLVGGMARKLSGYLPILGVTPETAPEIDALLLQLLDILERLLAKAPYLLGQVPCVGDLSIGAQLYAHGWRDPYSRHLFDPYPLVTDWLKRLKTATECIPARIEPGQQSIANVGELIQFILRWAMPLWTQSMDNTQTFLRDHPHAKRIPRGMGKATIKLGNKTTTRAALSYHQWMLQFALSHAQALTQEERADWLHSTNDNLAWSSRGKFRMLKMENYRLKTVG